MTLLDDLLAKNGKSRTDFKGNSKIGQILRTKGIQQTVELNRVLNLPRRIWETDPDLPFLVQALTDLLKTPNGTQTLRPVQAAALRDLHDTRGLLGPIPVGSGKTLITRLAPILLHSKRPLLVIPANLRAKTIFEFEQLNEHWQAPENYAIFSYEELGREDRLNYIENYAPDLIVSDEAHNLKNRDAGVTRRIERWLIAHPETFFAAMSGTITKKSLMDFHHLLRWSIGLERMPLPASDNEAQEWALAVDPIVKSAIRMSIGALESFENFLTEQEREPLDTLSRVQEGLGRRIRETAGVVSKQTSDVAASLYITVWRPELPSAIQQFIEDVKDKPIELNGDVLDDEDLTMFMRQVCLGFYYEWDPAPPREWVEARRAWKKLVRLILDARVEGIDTEAQVATNIILGKLGPIPPEYTVWKDLRDTFKPNPVARWIDKSMCSLIASRIEQPTLTWVHHVAVGNELAAQTARSFFHKGGVDASGRPVEAVAGAETVILSIASNAEGRNLQAWHRNLIVSPVAQGALTEQIIGRSHREGQDSDAVEFVILSPIDSTDNAIRAAKKDAMYLQKVTGIPQKMLMADWSTE
jgi:hypothetical protein